MLVLTPSDRPNRGPSDKPPDSAKDVEFEEPIKRFRLLGSFDGLHLTTGF